MIRLFHVSFIALFLITLSCNDGLLGLKAINFDEQNVASCKKDITATVFFKLKSKEVLILQIKQGILNNKLTETPIERNIPSDAKLIYRVFKESITQDYFCSELPSTKHQIVTNAEAVGGKLIVETKEDEAGGFRHTFTIKNLQISNNGESLGSDLLFYGGFTTQIPPQ